MSQTKYLLIKSKPALEAFYADAFIKFDNSVKQRSLGGTIIEIGSGSKLIKDYIPHARTTDLLKDEGIDFYLDGTEINLPPESVDAFFLLNVLHHIPDKHKFFNEISRCLRPGGLLFIRDQYLSFTSRFIFKYLHHEYFNENNHIWSIPSDQFSENGASSHIIFNRERKFFEERWKMLEIVKIERVSAIYYWICGGLKKWNLVPASFSYRIMAFDEKIAKLFPFLCSFSDIQIIKRIENNDK